MNLPLDKTTVSKKPVATAVGRSIGRDEAAKTKPTVGIQKTTAGIKKAEKVDPCRCPKSSGSTEELQSESNIEPRDCARARLVERVCSGVSFGASGRAAEVANNLRVSIEYAGC